MWPGTVASTELSRSRPDADNGRVGPLELARRAVSDEFVDAAIFQVRRGSSLPVESFVLVAVSRQRIHLIELLRRPFRWKAGRVLASWDRSIVQAEAHTTVAAVRLRLMVRSDGTLLDLAPPPVGRAANAARVARLLAQVTEANHSAEPRGGLMPVGTPLAPRLDTGTSLRLHRWAGMLVVIGGLTRLAAYLLPWVVLSRADGLQPPVTVPGLRVLGFPVLSLGVSIGAIVVGIRHLRDRRSGSRGRLLVWGAAAAVASLMQLWRTQDALEPARRVLAARGVDATVTLGIGVWLELVGALLILVGGMAAWRAYAASAPGRPDLEAASRR
jgi:hypothetical protein